MKLQMRHFSSSRTPIAITMIKPSPSKVYSFWDTIWVLYLMVKSFGYISFSIDGKIQNGKIKTTLRDILILLFGASFVQVVIYLNFTHDLTLIKTNSFIIDSGNRITTLFIISNVLLSSLMNTLRRRQIWNIFAKISNFDKEVCKWN